MSGPNIDYLRENKEYIDIVNQIIEHEESLDPDEFEDMSCIDRFNDKNDTDHDVCWINTDISAHPSKLYQLEINGFLDRLMDTNSITRYSMSHYREEVKDMIDELQQEVDDGYRTVMHDFPDEDELDGVFDDVVGYDRVKWLLKRAISTNDITNVVLYGPTGSAKTVFLMCINRQLSDSIFMSGSPTSGPGVIDKMFAETPKYMLIDEMDDMDNGVQEVLSQYTETGIVDETKIGKDRKMKTNIKTFGSANSPDKIIAQVDDRFLDLHFEAYDLEEFIEICEHLLPKREGATTEEANYIAKEVWEIEDEADVRKAIQVARLSRGDPENVIEALKDYSKKSSPLL